MGQEPDSLQKMDEVDLLRCLRGLMLDTNCHLVVIDDIWDVNVWTKIKKAFPPKNGSRVIITTQNKKVAEGVDDNCSVHQLRFLRDDESWHLFCRRAEPKQNLEKIGKEMRITYAVSISQKLNTKTES
ncbi:disease resistance protein RPP13-like [Apium graveolens]|uniref:disease resistance protein RPP13-like n=1 Tax=Apium graveolens TaxID=4045 RepID=UPI003D792103